MNKNSIFSSASVLLPPFTADPVKMAKWAVIACDQFTSEPEYWEKCEKLTSGEPSALSAIMPEAYLGTPAEEKQLERIESFTKNIDAGTMLGIDGYIYLERTLPNGSLRRGIIGKLDLDAYDYSPASSSPVRATEATVVERIPPRSKIRAFSKIELPHILILTDDGGELYDKCSETAKKKEPVYDFDLMLGGGHVRGYALEGEDKTAVDSFVSHYENEKSGVVYAMGDGNHSLAAAKAHWESLKKNGAPNDHPARYALCELTPLGDDSLVFEPIYRLVKNCDTADFMKALSAETSDDADAQTVKVITGGEEKTLKLRPTHALTVGTLQNIIDGYVKSHPGVVCDYIHGENSVKKLATEENSVGFIFDGMDKNSLFPYVNEHGVLPRKTFSMGEAESKRYYIEARLIK